MSAASKYFPITLRIILTIMSAAWLVACGYKGALYLPPASAPNSDRPPVTAPLHFHAVPGVHVSTAYPDYPPSNTAP